MRGLHLRQVHGSEEAGVLSALTTGSPTAVIGPRRMRALLEAAPAAATTVLTAMEGQQLRGYVHLSTEEGAAWLVSGAVDPAHRRRGIGTALLREAARCARAAGARSLRISGRPAGYAAPGVDPERDPGTAGFLARRGARPAGTALAMTRPLHDLPVGRDRPGLHVATCREQDGPELLAVVEEHLDPGWAALLRRHAGRSEPRERSQPSADLERILLARDRDGALLGFAGWGLVGPDPSRFGPFGVVPHARGTGAGAALLDRALQHMAGEGLAHAWFQWTAPDTPAHRLYSSRGFTTLRTFTPVTLPLTDDAAPPGAEAGPTVHQEGTLR